MIGKDLGHCEIIDPPYSRADVQQHADQEVVAESYSVMLSISRTVRPNIGTRTTLPVPGQVWASRSARAEPVRMYRPAWGSASTARFARAGNMPRRSHTGSVCVLSEVLVDHVGSDVLAVEDDGRRVHPHQHLDAVPSAPPHVGPQLLAELGSLGQ